jgi:hypothetical protein
MIPAIIIVPVLSMLQNMDHENSDVELVNLFLLPQYIYFIYEVFNLIMLLGNRAHSTSIYIWVCPMGYGFCVPVIAA